MKQFIVIALLAVVVTTTYGDDSSDSSSIQFKPPAYPPSCCDNRFGCSASELAPYCPPCTPNCSKLGCACTFPGTNEVIRPRPAPPAVPRAPFCPQCPKFFCPVSRIVCLDLSNYTCTAEQIQAWIN